MKPTKYTTREVASLLIQGSNGIDELLKNKERLKEIHLLLIMELAVEYIAIGQADDIKQPTEKK